MTALYSETPRRCFSLSPPTKPQGGDIILVGGKPKCVIEAEKNRLTVINYEDSTIDIILPERHVIMGNTYFYGKIVSMFGNSFGKGKKGVNKIFQYMMMSEMMKGSGTSGTNAGANPMSMLPMMMFSNGGDGNFFDDMFGEGMFDLDDDEDEENDENDDTAEPEDKPKESEAKK